MRFSRIHLILIMLLVLLLGVANVCAVSVEDVNSTQTDVESSISISNDYQLEDNSPIQLSDDSSQTGSDFLSSGESDEIEVESWEDLQYYSSLSDKNYNLKLKENTNYYPGNVTSTDSQIIFNNNVTIRGAQGAYIGDSSPNARNITYTAMVVPDGNGVGITLQNVVFKWIGTRYQPDGVFLQMGGNSVNYIENCYFTNISTNLGHSSIVYIKLGDAIVNNCTFVNCTTDFGCLSVYNPDDDPTKTCTSARMNVTDSYFEGNYARTEPGCINNCGVLIVSNSTFYNNSAFWWAGAIHTHGGANTTLYDCNFTDNVAGWNGGALYTYSYLQIYRTIFIGNNCTTNNGGGAIGACKYLHSPYIYIEDSLFEDNENTCWGLDELSTTGTGRGGAISIMDDGGLEVRNTTFIKNSASLGTAICAIGYGQQNLGSPYVILVGNRFINHTRVGDVLDIRLQPESYCEISDNYYFNNSFEYKKLRLIADEKIGKEVVVHIDAELKNPDSFESDILDTSEYDVYVDGVYNKTVVGRSFTLYLEDGETRQVYVAPCISNNITNQILVGKPIEYIYVSTSGNDNNSGLTRSTPVRTIAKAIELARDKGYIKIIKGTYSESNLTVDYDLSIEGENNVKFSGTIPLETQCIFKVTDADLSLKGITFDGITFTANNNPYKNKKVILHSGGYLTIDDCKFSNIYPNGNTGMVLIESSNVEVYNSQFTNNNRKSIHIQMIKSNEFLVDNCTFSNNLASSPNYNLISSVSSKSGIKGTISNSIFENNVVKYGCIYFNAEKGKPLTISNTKFIANSVASTSDHSSCIKVEYGVTLKIESSVFMDNVNLGSRAAVIYVSDSSAAIYVSDSIILNNSYANNNNLVFNYASSSGAKNYRNLNGNWWGNTVENMTVAPPVSPSACNSWIVLNATANATSLGTGQSALVTFNLNNLYDKEFNESFYDAGKLPQFDLNIQAINGTSNLNKVTVKNGMANVIYSLQGNSGSLTGSYKGVQSTINFTWTLINPEITVDVANITYGSDEIINISLPSDISLNGISLTLNGNNLNANNVITLSDLDAGDYVLDLSYPGNSKYYPFNLVKTFTVTKADPQITIDVNSENYYGDSIRVAVNTLVNVEGVVTISTGNITRTGSLVNGKRIFSLTGLDAGNYTIVASYPGNNNYLSASATASFIVKKYNSTITISNGSVELGKNVVLTFNVNSDATGTVTVNVDGSTYTVDVSNGQATYTISKITRGLHNIEATYNGDAKYLPSSATTVLDVSRLNPSLVISVSDITYGQDANVQISLANAATGNVTVTVDDKTKTVNVVNGQAVAAISDLSAGNGKVVQVTYSGDTLYAPIYKTARFNVAKAASVINIAAPDIKKGQVANIQITISQGATGTLALNYAGHSENVNIPRTGLISRSLSDLAVGTYSVSASFAGDSNYLSSSATKSFNVDEWIDAQWPNEGYDIQNSGQSPYASNANGYVKLNVTINGNVIGNMVIDSQGYIYIVTDNGIYSYTNAGRAKWNFNSQDAGNNFSGVAVGREVIVSPKSGDKLYFINQTTGQKYNNNIYQGSSIFAPVMDEDANIYITSEYQYSSSCYNLVIVPYSIWQSSTNPTLISLGQHVPTTAPIIINNEYAAVGSEDGLLIVDLSSGSLISIFDDVITSQRPVVGPDGIIYAITDDNLLMAVHPVEGIQWLAEITGTHGDSLVVNGDYVYSVNKEGALYQYYYGDEYLLYEFNDPVSSGMLMGNDGTLYIGSESGKLYAINNTGEMLWQTNLYDPISGSPIMDKNGVIYLIAGGNLYGISSSRLLDPQLSGTISDAVYGDDVVANVELNSSATGTVSITVGGEYYESEVNNGGASFDLSDLNAGTYTARIYYSGDNRFKAKYVNVPFTISKADVDLIVNGNNINVGEVLRVSVSNFPSFATGTVQLSVDGKTNTVNVINGNANLAVSGLAKGEYTYTVTYSGDRNYNPITISKLVSVGYISTSFNAATSDITVGQTAVVTVSGLPNDANGITYITLNGQNYTAAVNNGGSTINIPNLAYGTYSLEVRYAHDDKYMANSKYVTLKVKKVNPSMSVSARDISVGSDLSVSVTLNSDASGNVLISVGDVSETVVVNNGIASTSISGLSHGSYILNISYSGDGKYNPKAYTKSINVNKVTPSMTISANKYSLKVGETLDVSVTLNNDASGSVVISVGDVSETVVVNNGAASTSISNLKSGSYVLNVSYSGDEKYNPRFIDTKTVTVTKTNVAMNVAANDSIYAGEDLTVTVNNLPNDGARYVLIIGDISSQSEVVNGVARFVISGLAAGEYNYNVYYPGNDKYNENTVSNIKTIVNAKEEVILRSSNVVISIGDEASYDVKLTDYDGNNIANAVIKIGFNGTYYNLITDSNGVASFPLNLSLGTYNINASFEGNRSHNGAFVSNTIAVNLINARLAGEDISMMYDDGTTYDLVLTDSNNNPISGALIKVNNTIRVSKYRTDANGQVSVPLSSLKPGTYVVTATLESEGIYNSTSITNNIVISKKAVRLVADNVTKGFIDSANYTVRLVDIDDNPISGVYISINNTAAVYKYKTDSDGYVSVPINMKIGNYVYTTKFSGNSLYLPATIKNSVIVGKSDVILTAEDVVMDYKDGTAYVVRFTDGLGKPIPNALINVYNTLGNYRYRTDADGYISSDKLNFLRPGEYIISAFFTETSVYKGLRIYNNATINKAKTQLSVSNVTMIYGDGSTYDAVLRDVNGNPIANAIVKVNDTLTATKYKTNASGSISAPISLGLGQYAFTAMFEGNALYAPSSATSTVTVNNKQISFTADDVNMVYRDGTNYLVRLANDLGDPISGALISVNNTLGVYKYRTNASGVASVPLTNLKPGQYVITATYDGEEVASPITISNNVIVNKIKTELSILEVNLDTSMGSIKLTDANGNPLANYAVKVTNSAGMKKYTTDSNGLISIPINTGSNPYAFKATFDGNAIYDSVTLKVNVVDNSIILSARDIDMYYNDGTEYVVKFTDISGNPISNALISVNNTVGVYKYRTDSNGYISAPKTNLQPGEYVFAAKFDGNGQYGAVNITNNVVINKVKTMMSVWDVSMRYNDGTNYVVKLTDADGNPISGVTISLNNGVSTYRYRTDEDGRISVPISLNVGEYVFTASFEGNNLYNSATRTSAVVIVS